MTTTQNDYYLQKYRLKAAMYKALLYNKSELADKIHKQLKENYKNKAKEFDIFCLDSDRLDAVHKTLEDMLVYNIISDYDYEFCKDV